MGLFDREDLHVGRAGTVGQGSRPKDDGEGRRRLVHLPASLADPAPPRPAGLPRDATLPGRGALFVPAALGWTCSLTYPIHPSASARLAIRTEPWPRRRASRPIARHGGAPA